MHKQDLIKCPALADNLLIKISDSLSVSIRVFMNNLLLHPSPVGVTINDVVLIVITDYSAFVYNSRRREVCTFTYHRVVFWAY